MSDLAERVKRAKALLDIAAHVLDELEEDAVRRVDTILEDARREIDGVIKELRKLDSQVESLLRTEGSAAFQLLLVERELGEARAAIDSARANLSRLLVEKHNRVKEILSASTTLDVIENDLTNTKLQTLETLIEKILGSVKR